MANTRIVKFNDFGELQVIDPVIDSLQLYDIKTDGLTVLDKSVILADGTLSNTGLIASILNFQTMYNNTDVSGHCEINLTSAKNIQFVNLIDNTFLIFNSDTGNLQISGDLVVGGTTTVVDSVITSYGELLISPTSNTLQGLVIEPADGVTPILPLMRVKKIFGGSDVFTIGSNGTTTLQSLVVNDDLTVSGVIINGDYSIVKNSLFGHIGTNSIIKHNAVEIGVDEYSNPSAVNIQTVVEDIDSRISTATSQINAMSTRVSAIEDVGATLIGYIHVQATPSQSWTIGHNKGNRNVVVAVYNADNMLIIPQSIDTTSTNSILITFDAAHSGRAVLTFVL